MQSVEILEPGPQIFQEEKSRFLKDYSRHIDNYEIIRVSGSLPRGLASNFYTELINIAKDKKKKVIMDTSGKTLEDILSAKPYMVKPNSDEISLLMNKEITTDEYIKDCSKGAVFYIKNNLELNLQ